MLKNKEFNMTLNTEITITYTAIEQNAAGQDTVLENTLLIKYKDFRQYLGDCSVNELFNGSDVLLEVANDCLAENEPALRKLHNLEDSFSSSYIIKLNPAETYASLGSIEVGKEYVCIDNCDDLDYENGDINAITNVSTKDGKILYFTFNDLQFAYSNKKMFHSYFVARDVVGKAALLLKEESEKHNGVDEAIKALLSDLSDEVLYTEKLLKFIAENYDITMFTQCSNCGEILFPEDEAYSDGLNDDAPLCDFCSVIDEGSNKYRCCHTQIVLAGHTIIIEGLNESVYEANEDVINTDISYELSTELNYSGSIELDGQTYDWELYNKPKEKLKHLKLHDTLVVESNQLIYQFLLRGDGEYEYNIYDLSDFISGDLLECVDGGIFETIDDVAEKLQELC